MVLVYIVYVGRCRMCFFTGHLCVFSDLLAFSVVPYDKEYVIHPLLQSHHLCDNGAGSSISIVVPSDCLGPGAQLAPLHDAWLFW